MRDRLLLMVVVAAVAALPSAVPSAAAPSGPPTGATGIALDARIELAWKPVSGSTAYAVYRGTSAGALTTRLTPVGGIAQTSYADTTAVNGVTYYYAARAIADGVESANSLTVQARATARACSVGNAVVLENCLPGTTPWNVRNTATIAAGGIEGYGTSPSINKGESVDLKVNAADSSTFRIEIFRTGYYGGDGARLFSTIRGVTGIRQPGCATNGTTGLVDCANWSVSATLTTTASWPSGVYLLRLVREDTGTDNQILLTVRDDARHSELLYGTADTNFQAYNNYGGRSLYDWNSFGGTTVAGTPRAVKVSYDRPYEQPRSGLRDWYTRTDFATVRWLEREGFDVAYQSNVDLERNGARLLDHEGYISPSHDEYYSSGMRSSLEAARAAGVNLFFTGSNEVYWRIRYEASPSSGALDRTQVAYKSTQSGGPDPSGIPTGTWRDPAGANQPENALTGVFYVGDNDTGYFPLRVSATEGSDRIWRYTGLDAQPPGSFTNIGSNLVGWEWDARVANGFEPAGVKTLASSPVTGQLVQQNGASYIPGSTVTTMVKYTAPSGALIVTTGTNHWNRGLERNADGIGEPEERIQQATTNILEDMGACPSTAAADITLDCASVVRPNPPTGVSAATLGTDSIRITWAPVAGVDGYNVYRSLTPRDGGQPLGALAAALVTGTSFTDTGLSSAQTYYYVVTSIKTGVQSLPSNEGLATTAAAAGQSTRLNSGGTADYTSTTGAVFRSDALFTGGSVFSDPARAITGTADPSLYRNERWGNFTYAVPVATGTYDVRFHFVELYFGTAVPGGNGKRVFSMDINDTTANPDLANIDIYAAVGKNAALVLTVPNVMVTDGTLNIRSIYGSADDPEVAAIEIIPQATPPGPPTVVDTLPLDAATGVSRSMHPTAQFSRAMDASTLTAASFTLTKAGGTALPATVSYDPASLTATLVPSALLDFSSNYTARLTTAVKAADGIALASAVTWTFTSQDAVPPQVTSTTPASGASGVSASARPRAVFSRSLDPATVTTANVTMRDSGGTLVPSTVAYDDSTRSVTLTPNSTLGFLTAYTVTIGTGLRAVDGVALAAPYNWSFTTGPPGPPPPTVTARTPAVGATGVLRTTTVDATFSRDMDAATITGSSFTLTGPSGAVSGAVTYTAGTRTARLTPGAPLAYATTYTATLTTAITASDGAPLASAVTWQFTTQNPPPPPTVSALTPADGAAYASRSAAVKATFSRSLDPATINATTFTLRRSDSSSVAATVTYNDATKIATLTPSAPLDGAGTFTARLDGAITAADGIALGTAVSWSFSTAACPCNLLSSVLMPSNTALATQDGRTGTGPWSYELGVKVTVDQPMLLTALRFFKSPSETGTHTGRVWTAGGAQLASVVFAGETAVGWQQQALAAPVTLQANTVYLLSVNANAFFVSTPSGFATQVVSGPIRSAADIANGVYGAAAGVFPTASYSSTNYFVDLEAVTDGDPAPPTVTTTAPANGATGVARTASAVATFSRPMDPASITTSSVTLRRPDSTLVPASVSYNNTLSTATLTPSSPLAYGTTYTAQVTTAARASDGMPLSAQAQWSFTTAAAVPPQVTATAPTNGSTGNGPAVRPHATFSKSLNPATVTASTFTLTGPSGAVTATAAYDEPTLTATLTPSSALAVGSYTARLDGSITAADDAQLGTAYTWSFTVVAAPAPLTVTAQSPAPGSNGVLSSSKPTATFSRGLDVATITNTSFTLRRADNSIVPATVAYNATTLVATLTPTTALTTAADFTARLETTIKAADGTPLAAAVTWGFSTGACPCTLFSTTLTPTSTNLDTRDGRGGTGPWTYELGVKAQVDQPMALTAIRFYKSPNETGTHVGRVWTVGGSLLGQVTFVGETASGWQYQALATPIALAADTTYVVSVNANTRFVATTSGLATQVVSGPLRSVVGLNGVYGPAAGTFPTSSYSSSNYLVDLEVAPQGAPGGFGVSATTPASGATAVSRTTTVTATFTQPANAATLTGTNFTLTGPSGAVAGTIAYNATTRTATLTPSAALAYGTTYTARLTTAVRSTLGNALPAAVQWTFTTLTSVAPTVSSTVPATGATQVAPSVRPRAVFSKPMDSATVSGATFTLTGPSGAVAGSVAYDAPSQTATFTPTAALANGSYTARLDGSMTSADSVQLGSAYTWSFSVSPPPALTITSTTPVNGATSVSRDTVVVRAVFSRALDPATVTTSSFRLRAPDTSLVPATVAYDAGTQTASLTPTAPLNSSVQYTAEVTTAVQASDGTPLSAQANWSFTTSACPCQLFSTALTPSSANLSTQDGRTGSGPWSYELGVKIDVTQASSLTAVRFYKAALETGTHTATIWTSGGTILATVAFTGETASGWQQQTLATPLALSPGATYVVSVGLNARFVATPAGLATQIVSGPLRSIADGQNGVYGAAAGTFPTSSYNTSNYFVDVVVR